MNSRYYKSIPCGEPLPLDNPHAFSVSIPDYQDVIDYEEEKNGIFDRLKTAYPRIVIHPYVKSMAAFIQAELSLGEGIVYVLPSLQFAEHISELSDTSPELCTYESYGIAFFPKGNDDNSTYFSFMKHCGIMVYSREAETFLTNHGKSVPHWEEEYNVTNPEQEILDVLTQGYGKSDILLSSSGMNALYVAYDAIKECSSEERTIYIQFGWLYTDSIHILRKCSDQFEQFGRVEDLSELKEFLAENGSKVAALFTETVSNPLLQTPDFTELYALSEQYDFSIVLDNTFATPWNVDVTPYADIIVESLTKFASGRGDCMSGAVIVPETSRISSNVKSALSNNLITLQGRDLQRLGATIGGYEQRIQRVNHNSRVVVDYLVHNPLIQVVHHVYSDVSCDSYRKIAKDDTCYGGIISFVIKGDFETFYNKLDLPKGPSLGSDFPLAMCYTLLAHYDLVNEPEQKTLNEIGLSPWLIRLSIGEDNPRLIIDAIENALV